VGALSSPRAAAMPPLSASAPPGYWPPHVAHFGLQGRASSPALPAAAPSYTPKSGDITLDRIENKRRANEA